MDFLSICIPSGDVNHTETCPKHSCAVLLSLFILKPHHRFEHISAKIFFSACEKYQKRFCIFILLNVAFIFELMSHNCVLYFDIFNFCVVIFCKQCFSDIDLKIQFPFSFTGNGFIAVVDGVNNRNNVTFDIFVKYNKCVYISVSISFSAHQFVKKVQQNNYFHFF